MNAVSHVAAGSRVSKSPLPVQAVAIARPSGDRLMLGRQEPRQGQAPSTFMGKLGAVGECAVAGAAVVGLLVAVLSGGAIPLILGAVGLGAVLGGVAGIISQI